MTGFAVREWTAADEPAVVALGDEVADGGRVAFTAHHHVPAVDVRRALFPDTTGVVAETASGRIVGSAWVRFEPGRRSGEPVEIGFLHGLAVHPDFRRLGVARAMTDWRLARIDERGRDVVAMATIQRGNAGSLANARRWATAITGDLRVTPVPVRRRRPPARDGWTVRPAVPADLDPIGAELDRRYRAFGFAPATGSDRLAAWLARAVGEVRDLNTYLVVTGRDGRLLAGLGIVDEPRLSDLRVRSMPAGMRLAARLVGVVGAGGVMRNLPVTLAWHRPDALDAGRFLWQSTRWRLRAHGTALVTTADARDPIAAMTPAPSWLPSTGVTLAVRTTRPWDDAALLAV